MPAATPGLDEILETELPAEPGSVHDAVREQFGKGDVDEMIFQLTGKRPGEKDTKPAASAGDEAGAKASAPAIVADVAAAAAQAGDAAPVRRRPPTGIDRARHHYGFKRVFWSISLAVGLVCLAMATWGFWPGPHSVSDVPDLETYAKQAAPDIEHPELHREFSHFYLIEKGAKVTIGEENKVYYAKEGGFEVPAVEADDWAEARQALDAQTSLRHEYWAFGVMNVIVGLSLLALGVWMLRDVMAVHRANASQAPAAEAPAGAAATASGDDSAVADLVPEDEAKK